MDSDNRRVRCVFLVLGVWRMKDGGPAFPIVVGHSGKLHDGGMSLRDYFAAKWLSGAATQDTSRSYEAEAQAAYRAADAMLKEREK